MTQETYDEICDYFSLADDEAEGDERALTFRGFYELSVPQPRSAQWGYPPGRDSDELRREMKC